MGSNPDESKTRYLMVQGTSSHVGKSIMVTALCRILHEEGYSVAPFKPQNMSLNSWVTKDGGEIGIAQAIQAWAAGLEPEVDMNPVLLKPKGDSTSQVILRGKPYADVAASKYYMQVEDALEVVLKSLRNLSSRYDIIIMEGAGSPAEINLMDREIANMRVAAAVNSPVLLVGDIERGGVFASLYGTWKLLPEEHRQLIKGFIINKFRGDKNILAPGLGELEALTEVPVLGVIPYAKLSIPSEDSVSIGDKNTYGKGVNIMVIRLPHISNFTDFEPLEKIANVVYVEFDDVEKLRDADMIIIPGTKNTVNDLKEIMRTGMDRVIKNLAGETPIIGVCGGYQMLGESIIDSGVEHEKGELEGLGLLPIHTVFDRYDKQTTQVCRRVTGDGPLLEQIIGDEVRGYEIHMGKSTLTRDAPRPFEDDGCMDDTGLVIGTYMHGLFNNQCVLDAVMSYLGVNGGECADNIDGSFHQLAELVKENVDMERIMDLIGL